jgi:hypothetical protein
MCRPCVGCGERDPLKFYDSIPKWCRECWKARVRANRAKNVEHYREYDRQRTDQPDRVEMRRAYRITPEAKCQAMARYTAKFPEKYTARNIVNAAIRDGKLKVQPCERCGYGIGVHAHHEDYSKPLEVVWLCRRHHGERHREINEERRRAA